MFAALSRRSQRPTGSRAARLARAQLWLGFALTAAVAGLQAAGLTARFEHPLFDLRMRLFNLFTPPPSDRVVVIAIDDGSIETVGKWPWPRAYLAQAIRELKRAGASVVALDLLHDDPQKVLIEGDLADPASLREIDNDRLLGEAIAAHGRVVQGARFNYIDPQRRQEERQRQASRGTPIAEFEDVLSLVASNPAVDDGEALRQLLPGSPEGGAHRDDLDRKLQRARTLLAFERRSSVLMPDTAARWPHSNDPMPPVPEVARGCAAIASVSFGEGDADGAVRRIPLWVEARGRLFPTLGLAATALHLGIPIPASQPAPDATELPLLGGRRLILPTHAAVLKSLADQGALDGLMYVAWPRGGWHGWKRQFAVEVEPGKYEESEFRLARLLDPALVVIPRIKQNILNLDQVMRVLALKYGVGDFASYEPRADEMASLGPDDERWRNLLRQQQDYWTGVFAEARSWLDDALASAGDPASLSPEERAFIEDLQATVREGPVQVEQVVRGLTGLDEWRDVDLPRRVRGKVCFIGWTAKGAAADFVRTSIDPSTPGVHVHAAVANAILTSVDTPQFLHAAPAWMNLAAVVALGILGTIVGVRAGVVQSPVMLVIALGAWFAVDGVVFWDLRNVYVAEAAPMSAALLGWVSVILHRLLVEQRSRKQTEARFRSYVSPDVVDILVNNPELNSMRPQRRELTIFFSDIAGWTTIAERLGTEGVAKFLATYLKEMTDILQNNRATIDKYLGDGIMAFWGAPIEDPDHAAHAVKAVVEMQQKLDEMNDAGAFGGAGRIGVRIGLASGEVNVGDFGNPPHKSAYTVIGDSANLAARLESANKQFGSRILITDRTRELAGLNGSIRLIGKVVVKGKTEPETLWEPIGSRRPMGDRTEDWIRLSNDAVRAYCAGDLDTAQTLFDRLESEFGDADLAEKYREAMAEVRAQGGPGPDFNGTIVLSEK